MLFCFAAALFLSATLLFLVQPMVARLVLPLLGGVPAVWNTCMVFFQAALLAGYAYAHLGPARLGVRRHALLHLGLLLVPLAVLPIAVRGKGPAAEALPVPWLLGTLLVCAGLPFFAVATTGPLLQHWFASTGHPAARDPYFLYGASNLGSLAALLAYPTLVEPNVRLLSQTWAWTGGYVLLIGLIGACALFLLRATPGGTILGTETPAAEKQRESNVEMMHARTGRAAPAVTLVLRWVALAFVPSSLMLGVTSFITYDLAPVPLFWVVPLAIYLLTFVLAFSRLPAWIHRLMIVLLPIAVVALAAEPFFLRQRLGLPEILGLHLGALFVAGMVCHGELARTRPPAPDLTAYYLWISLGGVLGGVFNALVAPVLFNRVIEYPLVIALACLLRPRIGPTESGARAGVGGPKHPTTFIRRRPRLGGTVAWILFGLGAAVAFGFGSRASDPPYLVRVERNFFGVIRVGLDPEANRLTFTHGTTLHGAQSRDPRLRGEPLTYYHRTSPIGQLFTTFRGPRAKGDVAVVGLGIGSLAAYAEPGQRWTFFEIDPAVERIARDGRLFTYLRDAQVRGADVRVVLGDARLRLGETSDRYGMLVLDAFSSDAIPVHLLTREALTLYLDRLTERGLLAFHLSSQNLELAPVVADLGREAGLACFYQDDDPWLTAADYRAGKSSSAWVMMARKAADFAPVADNGRWTPVSGPPAGEVWTDDFSSLFSVIIWREPAPETARR